MTRFHVVTTSGFPILDDTRGGLHDQNVPEREFLILDSAFGYRVVKRKVVKLTRMHGLMHRTLHRAYREMLDAAQAMEEALT